MPGYYQVYELVVFAAINRVASLYGVELRPSLADRDLIEF